MKLLCLFIMAFHMQIMATELTKTCYTIDGMHCGSCSEKIEQNLIKNKSIKNVEISIRNATGAITYNSNEVNSEEIEQIIKKAGYEAKKSKCPNL
jgi:Cu+-exporting ATPase